MLGTKNKKDKKMICDYGCGQEANYHFKNGKWCCSDHWLRCPAQKKRVGGNNNPFYGKTHSDETKKKCSESNKGKPAWNKGIPRTNEEKLTISRRTREEMKKPILRKRLSENLKGKFVGEKHPRWNGGYYDRKIPLYDTYATQISYAEKCRRSPTDPKVLEVTCAYCGKWHIPTVGSIYERIRALNGRNYGEQRLYCSTKCKQECPIFHQIAHAKDHKPATSREVQPELRQLRFVVDNYTCQKCGKHQDELDCGLHCHHLEGIRWEPIESADIDKVITLCKKCHLLVHKKEGCGYNDLRCNSSDNERY